MICNNSPPPFSFSFLPTPLHPKLQVALSHPVMSNDPAEFTRIQGAVEDVLFKCFAYFSAQQVTVAHVGFSCFVMNLLGVDKDGAGFYL